MGVEAERRMRHYLEASPNTLQEVHVMKRVIALLGMVSALALSAHANIFDFETTLVRIAVYCTGGANRIVLDDVGRVTPGGALIKQINIGFYNASRPPSMQPLYVFDATGAGGGVGNLLHTATIQNIPNGLFQLHVRHAEYRRRATEPLDWAGCQRRKCWHGCCRPTRTRAVWNQRGCVCLGSERQRRD
jgi:hypothetical protein